MVSGTETQDPPPRTTRQGGVPGVDGTLGVRGLARVMGAWLLIKVQIKY